MGTTKTVTAEKKMSPMDRAKKIAESKGWGALTEEEKIELDELVRSFTNLN